MRITSLTLKNWRTFKTLELRDIGSRLIIVGPNASGKSNLLDAAGSFAISWLRQAVCRPPSPCAVVFRGCAACSPATTIAAGWRSL